jgi:N utilization substance protein B
MGARRQARELALQLLYQNELTCAAPEDMERHLEGWQAASVEIRSFADELLRGVLANLEEVDDLLRQQTAHWRLERLAMVDRNILRLAMYELLYRRDTPPAVAIDEAIEIAKKFGAEESPRFVNGVLDGFLKRKPAAG